MKTPAPLFTLSLALVACAQGTSVIPVDPQDSGNGGVTRMDAPTPVDTIADTDLGARDLPPTQDVVVATDARDAAVAMDVGAPVDRPAPIDVGTPVDLGAPVDRGVPVDVSTPVDLGACGQSGLRCCASEACQAPLICEFARCVAPPPCGATGQACCGTACAAGSACVAGRCDACGASGQPCCGAICGAGAVCVSARCAADVDGDRSPAGTDCDDRDPGRYPGARERCNGRDDDCDAESDEGACGIWFLPTGAATWSAWPLDAARDANPTQRTLNAPLSPVRAAFDIESQGIAYVITDATWHLLDLGAHTWTSSGALSTLFPETRGRTIVTAYTVPAAHGSPGGTTEGVTFLAREGVIQYGYDLASRAFTFTRTDPTPTWMGSAAPSYASLRFGWLDTQNADGWVTASPASFCPPGTTSSTRVGPYYAVVTDSSVHLGDAGYCWAWITAVPRASFAPFARPSAPPLSRAGAMFYRGGLWVIAAE